MVRKRPWFDSRPEHMEDSKIKVIRDALEERGVPSKEIEETVEALKMKAKQEKEKEEQEQQKREHELELERQREVNARIQLAQLLINMSVKEYEERVKEWNRPMNRLKRFFDL